METTNCRVLKSKSHRITQGYSSSHKAVDLVKHYSELDYITAHSDGVVVEYRKTYRTTDKEGNSYGNYVKIKHDNNYYTLYAHMQYNSVTVKTGDKVKAGDVIGYMGNTGHSFGGHLHFEVRRGNEKINPTAYLTKGLNDEQTNKPDKSIDELAKDVISGLYGNGEERKKKLGSKYSEVQKRVNELLSKQPILYKTVVNCSYLNLRTTASYGNNVYKAVKSGTKLEYLGLENGWSKVKYNNKILFCGKNYLK